LDIFWYSFKRFWASCCWVVNGVPSLADLGLLSFGLLGIVNFAMALYVGAFAIWILLDKFGINYWAALVLAPLLVGDASAW
jgi:branched-chain amino acid transport system permease protein